MSYNEIYANRTDSQITYKRYENVLVHGGKTRKVLSLSIENAPAAVVKFPSNRKPGQYGYTEEEILQIVLPFDFVEKELGGSVSKEDMVQFNGRDYRVESVTDLTYDPLWGVYLLELRRIRNAA